ncbi:MAG: hypothetical protein ACSHXB_15105 [Sulfitobacter sp.]
MFLAYLFNAMIVAVVCTFLWIVTGGSLAMGFVVYTMSGLLMIAAMISASVFKSRDTRG